MDAAVSILVAMGGATPADDPALARDADWSDDDDDDLLFIAAAVDVAEGGEAGRVHKATLARARRFRGLTPVGDRFDLLKLSDEEAVVLTRFTVVRNACWWSSSSRYAS